jgi:hypothetical protein
MSFFGPAPHVQAPFTQSETFEQFELLPLLMLPLLILPLLMLPLLPDVPPEDELVLSLLLEQAKANDAPRTIAHAFRIFMRATLADHRRDASRPCSLPRERAVAFCIGSAVADVHQRLMAIKIPYAMPPSTPRIAVMMNISSDVFAFDCAVATSPALFALPA